MVRGSGSGAQVKSRHNLRASPSHMEKLKRKITKRLVVKSKIASSISHKHTVRLGAFRHLMNLVFVLHYWFGEENPLKVG